MFSICAETYGANPTQNIFKNFFVLVLTITNRDPNRSPSYTFLCIEYKVVYE